MNKEFYSNGKLLLSGEYAILDGAQGWAIPTKLGQYLKVNFNFSGEISWKSIDANTSTWFEGKYKLDTLEEIATTDKGVSKNLLKLLTETRKLNPSFLADAEGYQIETTLTFPRNWGLGSSSTLINNLGTWANVNPYTLLAKTFGGSGYDIACAKYDKPILFQLKEGIPLIKELEPIFPFSDALFFVYLNQKKNSREAISAYRKLNVDKKKLAEKMNQITRSMIVSQHLSDFEHLIRQHELILSNTLQIPTIKEQLFSDYSEGSIKSLGAWGGDFILVTGNEMTPSYFKNKGYKTILSFSEMAL